MTPELSVIIPVYNEAGNIGPLLGDVAATLRTIGRACEIIVVNDGSTDDTAAEVERAFAVVRATSDHTPTLATPAGAAPLLAQGALECRQLPLARNGGQADALLAGLRAAQGGVIITLDGDGQNDPHDIPALLALVDADAVDLACGWRVKRHDAWLRRAMSRLSNRVRRGLLHDQVHDSGCQLRVFRRAVVSALVPMELMQSFVPALAVAAGFRVGERPVRHHARRHGRSKYGLGRLWWRPAFAMVGLWWRSRRNRSVHA